MGGKGVLKTEERDGRVRKDHAPDSQQAQQGTADTEGQSLHEQTPGPGPGNRTQGQDRNHDPGQRQEPGTRTGPRAKSTAGSEDQEQEPRKNEEPKNRTRSQDQEQESRPGQAPGTRARPGTRNQDQDKQAKRQEPQPNHHQNTTHQPTSTTSEVRELLTHIFSQR